MGLIVLLFYFLYIVSPSWASDLHRVDKRAAPKITNKNPYAAAVAAASGIPSVDGRCMARVQSALGDMMSAATVVQTGGTKNGNRRHTATPAPGFMDLSGYALHQRLRTAPGAEMYVTGMRAKLMPTRDAAAADSSASGSDTRGDHRSWARVDGCQYDPLGNTLEARMRFGRTIMVSGSVRLLYGGGGGNINRGVGSAAGETGCDMTLRLRPRAGLGFTAAPLTMPEKSPPNRLTATPTMTIRTTATFIDPEPADDPASAYVSVHSYNCVGGAAGFPGNREHPSSASSDRYEQIMSAEEGNSDELLSAGDMDIDTDDGTDLTKFGDMRSSSRRPSPSSSSSASSSSSQPSPSPSPPPSSASPSNVDVTPAVTHLFVPAGFVAPAPVNPEPRIRRIQYHNKPPTSSSSSSSPHHPLMTVAGIGSYQQQTQDQLLMEMEDVFVRGVRSLLAKHMERTLQPVLKDSLMANMGYTVSYG